MTLPKIMPSRLQRVVADSEFGTEFKSFQELCEAVADTQWAKSFDLNATVIGALMVEHGTLTKVDKPESVELPPEPEPEPVVAVAKDEKVVKTYDEGGKGKKQCPACKKYVGLRTALCACGHAFVSKAKTPKPQEEEADEDDDDNIPSTVAADDPEPVRHRRHVQHAGRGMRVHTPAGACPHRLTATDAQTVEDWAEHVRKTFLDRDGSWLTVPALKYFAQEYFPVHNTTEVWQKTGEGMTPEYKAVCAALDTIYPGE
jgi:hypothetical protein